MTRHAQHFGKRHPINISSNDHRRRQATDDDDADTTTTAARTTRTTTTAAREPLGVTETTSTTTRARTTSTADDADDDTTTTSTTRAARTTTSTTSADSTSTTSTSTTPSLTTAPTTTAVRSTSTTSSTSSTTSRRVASTSSTSALSSSTTGSSASTSASGLTSNDAGASSSTDGKSTSHAGVIAGVIIALLAVAALGAFFGLRWKKKRARAAEDAALFGAAAGAKEGSGSAGGPYGGKRQSNAGYAQQIDSYDDLLGSSTPGYGGVGIGAGAAGYGYGEKEYGASSEKGYNNSNSGAGMAGYGTLSSMHNLSSAGRDSDNGNMAGVGRGSYASSRPGMQASGAFSPRSDGMMMSPGNGNGNGAGNGSGYGEYGYPPIASSPSGPQAAMMRGMNAPTSPDQQQPSTIHSLPAHQHQALNSALATGAGAGVGAGLAAAAAAAAAGGMPVPGARQSMQSQTEQQEQDQQPDEGLFEDPATEGKIYIVTRVFEPTMPDELVILPGDKIQIVMSYDDGWCLGCNLSSETRDGGAPKRGVFPRDCVEEHSSGPMSSPSPTPHEIALPDSRAPSRAVVDPIAEEEEQLDEREHDLDKPLVDSAAELERAPTLPPLEMSRFSIGSGGSGSGNGHGNNNGNVSRAGSRASTVRQRPAQQQQLRQSLYAPTIREDDGLEDAYGGFAAPSPAASTFPPDIQVNPPVPQAQSEAQRQSFHGSSSSAGDNNSNKRSSMAMNQFGSSQHIADYASSLSPDGDRRLSSLDEEEGATSLLDEFPSTPRTATSPASTHTTSTHTNTNTDTNMRRPASLVPGGSASRLSMMSGTLSSSASARSLKRTSSLVASKDADLFLALGDVVHDSRA